MMTQHEASDAPHCRLARGKHAGSEVWCLRLAEQHCLTAWKRACLAALKKLPAAC